jgi:hypothetical protein
LSFFDFELFFTLFVGLPLFVPFVDLTVFLLLDDLLELFLTFWSPSYASWVLDSNFKLCAFCCQWT